MTLREEESKLDYFKVEFNGGLYILPNEYKKEFKEFLSDRTTSLTYLARHHTIEEIAQFLRTEDHVKTIMQKARRKS